LLKNGTIIPFYFLEEFSTMKKAIAILLTVVMVFSITASAKSPTIEDALDILMRLAGLPSTASEDATIEDVLEILLYLAGLPSVYDTPVTTPPTTTTAPPTTTAVATTTSPQTTTAPPVTTTPPTTQPTTPPNKQGNTSGNIANGGIAAIQGDWIYYRNNGIWKIRTDGTEKQKLTDDIVAYINVIGDWIYYNGRDFDETEINIRRIRTDGTQKANLNNVNSWYVTVIGDWIYYLQTTFDEYGYMMGGDIYKTKTDGTEVKQLTNSGYISSFSVDNGFIYYMFLFEREIHVIDTNGENASTINVDTTWGMSSFLGAPVIVQDSWIYCFYHHSEGEMGANGILKINKDGASTIVGYSHNFNIDGEWIYGRVRVFDDWFNASNTIFKSNINDNTGSIKLTDISNTFGPINIVGDWIYFLDSDVLYKMKTDGSNVQIVE